MNPYSLLRPLLFSVDPEAAHDLSLKALTATQNVAVLLYPKVPDKPVTVMGLTFKNPVGLAAGLDKDGDCLDGFAALGFGFLEIGTVTPRPQPGNPKPRLFRLPEHEAIINRMGFNNKGIDYLLAQVERSSYAGVLGINIGKNFVAEHEKFSPIATRRRIEKTDFYDERRTVEIADSTRALCAASVENCARFNA